MTESPHIGRRDGRRRAYASAAVARRPSTEPSLLDAISRAIRSVRAHTDSIRSPVLSSICNAVPRSLITAVTRDPPFCTGATPFSYTTSMRAERELLPRCCLSANAWRSSAARDCSALSECYEGGLRDRSADFDRSRMRAPSLCRQLRWLPVGSRPPARALLAEGFVPPLRHEQAASVWTLFRRRDRPRPSRIDRFPDSYAQFEKERLLSRSKSSPPYRRHAGRRFMS